MKQLLSSLWVALFGLLPGLYSAGLLQGADKLVFEPTGGKGNGKHVVLIAGDEEYRSEESMPMLGKILSHRHGYRCTVLFAWGPDGASYIDANNSRGLRGLDSLANADLMVIGTRFRNPDVEQAKHIADYLNAGKPVIGFRTATHAFQGKGDFGGLPYNDFGLKILGETWVSHHGKHKVQGARGVVSADKKDHPILRSVQNIFCPSDVYGVIHLQSTDEILMRAAVTESLDPSSPNVAGSINDPMQPFAWVRDYQRPNGKGTGKAFCTTGGASIDFLNEDLRRLVVNAALFLTGQDVPEKTNVDFVDPFQPTFYGFINDKTYWSTLNRKAEDYGLGKSPTQKDPPGTPEWKFRLTSAATSPAASQATTPFEPRQGERIAFVGSSLGERMNLFGYFETLLHTRFPNKQLVVRNFSWPGDEVGLQQRPDDYTKVDDPMEEFGPELFICFFGMNEHFAGGSDQQLDAFKEKYRQWIARTKGKFSKEGREARFVLVSPIAMEQSKNVHLPDTSKNNPVLAKYATSVQQLAKEMGLPFIDVYTPSLKAFSEEPDLQYTINTLHVNERGDRMLAKEIDSQLFSSPHPTGTDVSVFHNTRKWVNDKSWLHLQDYRMLNGWYVYGGRRTWDTETFPKEFQKIRKMVGVRDQYIWDMVAGKPVAEQPDDSKTGEVFIPETMFGTRDEGFRQMREPKTLVYPTPEESIKQMKVPEGFEVQLFASEKDFPELANPTQMMFDKKGRLWVSCMINYPQWLPGSAKPGDKILIFEDTNNDGKADVCKTFYDKLICPTGFEFHEDGVLVVDQPRIILLKDTDGDDKADEVTQVIDGIATDDTHHTVGAWEWSHGGLLYMLEGVSMSTTMETPWGPFRNKGPSGAYVVDPKSWKVRHFRTPGYGNPWCMVFDKWGMGTIGDGTNAQQHWTSPLSGFAVNSRKTLRPNFDNQGIRPAVGNDFLITRQFPEEVQGQFIYACVINLHGLPRFNVRDESEGAGFTGERIDDLINSTDNFFRPVDPQIGPDGALWFGDWCNALIGHMQYSQRDPNRDHVHGRLYRLVYKNKPLLKPVLQDKASIDELLGQLSEYEPRTRYRARRELWSRNEKDVLSAVDRWIAGSVSEERLCEALWLQERFNKIDPKLASRMMQAKDFHVRAALVHAVSNQWETYPEAMQIFKQAVADEHPRVRLEAVRGLSFLQTPEAAEVALMATTKPMDYWIEYTLEHTLQALAPKVDEAIQQGKFLADATDGRRKYYDDYKLASGPGGRVVKPLRDAENPELPKAKRDEAMRTIASIEGGSSRRGEIVFNRVCSACHQIGDQGKPFGPRLDDVGARYSKDAIIRHILWPNDTIAKGYETIQLVTVDEEVVTGFVLKETPEAITLGIATTDGKGKEREILKSEIDLKKEMKASSMPEGLAKTIAPSEFLDLIEYLGKQNKFTIREDGWIETGAASGDLRKVGEFVEISRDAQLQLPSNFPAQWSGSANLVLSAVDPTQREFSFHSPNEGSESPAVGIRLASDKEIRVIQIQNRRNPQFYNRAKDLAVWVSNDGMDWKKVWKSEKPSENYTIELPAGTRGRYIKVGLDGRGILHLNQIVVYGTGK